MLFNTRNVLTTAVVVAIHGGMIYAAIKSQEQITPSEIVPIAILGSLVVAPAAGEPSDGMPAPVETEAPAEVPAELPPPQEPPPPPPEPELPKPEPELPKPEPKPELPKPKPEPPKPRPEPAKPRQEVKPAQQEKSAEQNPHPHEVGTSAKSATRGDPEGAKEAVVDPSYNASYLRNPKPSYPNMSRRLKEEGRVLLRVLISADGTAKQVELKRSSGYKRLDDSALTTVKRWRFVPAKRGGQPIEMWYDVPISFSLKNS